MGTWGAVRQLRFAWRGGAWVAVYLVFVLAPLFALLIGPLPPSRDFRRHLPPPYAAHEYFICGPDVMMDGIERALGELDVPMSRYHSERYSFV